jgi:hypothetical protein
MKVNIVVTTLLIHANRAFLGTLLAIGRLLMGYICPSLNNTNSYES